MKKKLFLSLLLIAFAFNSYSQIPKSQIVGRINFDLSPSVELTKVAKDYNVIGSLSGNIIFNNKLYVGGYFSKKTIPVLHTDFMPGFSNDVSFQHVGINIGGHIVSIKRKDSYVIRKSKIRATFGCKIGGGMLWLNDDNWNKVTSRDYFYIIQPHAGIYRKLGTYVFITGGAYFQATYGAFNLGSYLVDKDFLSPGVFMSLHITTFK